MPTILSTAGGASDEGSPVCKTGDTPPQNALPAPAAKRRARFAIYFVNFVFFVVCYFYHKEHKGHKEEDILFIVYRRDFLSG